MSLYVLQISRISLRAVCVSESKYLSKSLYQPYLGIPLIAEPIYQSVCIETSVSSSELPSSIPQIPTILLYIRRQSVLSTPS